ncbi:hypothetical protein IP68_02145 [Blastomonas sp. AAP25]|uniref:hypothetical protein n=1 Tax=Blastomonas sp. AAP25 TaxID=1523416 RepID=UPI0006B90E13|nr:hypothetical protein [Blastomonas sp. AAP25]KPF76719.1 hypothetical protein IP68_02145 [Blastomonas sp. AAP25]
MTPEALALFGQFGFPGLLIGYLIWRDKNQTEKAAELERLRSEENKLRTEADKALATALAGLTITIQNFDQRFK